MALSSSTNKKKYLIQYENKSTPSSTTAPKTDLSAAQSQLNKYLSSLPRGTIGENKYKSQYENAYNALVNRGKFNYSQAKDPLYQQYEDMYTQNAKLAMQDTVGQVSALTGGYGNSYAQTAGQAMYNQAMSGLNDKALELYNAAMDRYNMEGNQLAQNYSAAANMYGAEQADILNRANLAEQQYQYDAARAYEQYRDNIAYQQWLDEFGYQQERDAAEDAYRDKVFDWEQATDARNFERQTVLDDREQANWELNRADTNYWNEQNLKFQDKWNQADYDLQKEALSWDKEKFYAEFNKAVEDGNYDRALKLMQIQQENKQFYDELDWKSRESALDRQQEQAKWDWQSAESEKDRTWQSGESALDRQWQSGESAKDRQWKSGESAKDRQWKSAESSKDRTAAVQQANAKAAASGTGSGTSGKGTGGNSSSGTGDYEKLTYSGVESYLKSKGVHTTVFTESEFKKRTSLQKQYGSYEKYLEAILNKYN